MGNEKENTLSPEEWINYHIRCLDKSVESNIKYTNIIITVAYTAFFILFTIIKDYPIIWHINWTINVKLIIGLLIGLSVFWFVMWEMIEMISKQPITTEYHRKLSELYQNNDMRNKETYNQALELQDKYNNKQNALSLDLWPIFFYPSAITGILAFILLTIAFIQVISK